MFKPEVRNSRNSHVAGIVPARSRGPEDFYFPYDFCLLPVSPDLLAVERAIVECAYVGCRSVWVICDDDVQLVLRRRMGDWLYSPAKRASGAELESEDVALAVPIYYVPIHQKDRVRRDNLGWRVAAGARAAFESCRYFSRLFVPMRYYVAFPEGVYPPWKAGVDKEGSIYNQNIYMRYDGKTVNDGLPLGFSFDPEQWRVWRDNIWGKGTGASTGSYGDFTVLPKSERWSATDWGIEKSLGHDIPEGSQFVDLDKFDEIKDWWGYCEALKNNRNLWYDEDLWVRKVRYHKRVGFVSYEEYDKVAERYFYTFEGWSKDERREERGSED